MSLELELIKEDQTYFQTVCHSRSNCVEYKITESFPFRIPPETFGDTRERTLSDRLVFVFQIASGNTLRLVVLL